MPELFNNGSIKWIYVEFFLSIKFVLNFHNLLQFSTAIQG